MRFGFITLDIWLALLTIETNATACYTIFFFEGVFCKLCVIDQFVIKQAKKEKQKQLYLVRQNNSYLSPEESEVIISLPYANKSNP